MIAAGHKALIEEHGAKYVAKFSSSANLYSVLKAEFIAMRLAMLVGINAAPVKLVQAANKDVLLIERFNREKTEGGWTRKSMVSALTLFGLDEMMARYASYETFAEIIRHRFDNPKETLKELFSRLVFNVLCGNTDDHARNHAAFWNGKTLSLTPAYDLCPQNRTGNVATQAMLISGDNRLSKLNSCLGACHHFLLSDNDAKEIVGRQREVIESHWGGICDEAGLSDVDRMLFWKWQFLNPFALED
jgi:serine/threonine-protein kinase HipA